MRVLLAPVAAALAIALALAGCAASAPTWTAKLGSSTAPPSSSSTAITGSAPAPAASTGTVARPVTTPRPSTTPCTSNRYRRWVFVSLRRQHLWMCARSRVVRDTPITSGMAGQYTETPTGTYAVQGLTRHTSLTLLSGESYAVDYWIPFDAPLFGFHDSSWQRFPYGSAKYRTEGSHGCIHVPLAAIRFMSGWAPAGTPVTIRAR